MKLPADLSAFILAALCVIAIAILAGLGIAIPEVLSTLALVAGGAGAGAALPRLPAAPLTQPAPPAVVGTGIIS